MTRAEAQKSISTKSKAIQLLSLKISIIQLNSKVTNSSVYIEKHSNPHILINIPYICHQKSQNHDQILNLNIFHPSSTYSPKLPKYLNPFNLQSSIFLTQINSSQNTIFSPYPPSPAQILKYPI